MLFTFSFFDRTSTEEDREKYKNSDKTKSNGKSETNYSEGKGSSSNYTSNVQSGGLPMSLNPFTNLPYTQRYYELYRCVGYNFYIKELVVT